MASKIDANCTLKPCDRQGKSNFLHTYLSTGDNFISSWPGL